MNLRFPKPTEPIAGAGGLITRSWRDYLASLSAQTVSAELFAAIAALNQRIDALSDGDWLSDETMAYGQYSVQSIGSLKDGTVIFQLQGDIDQPGPSFYYGTNDLGVKGWWELPEANMGELLTDQTGEQLTDQLGIDLTGQAMAIDWAQIENTPTTLSGYGITDAVPATRTLTAGTGLTGGGNLSADRSFAIAATAVTPGSYGNSTNVATFTVGADGRLTAAAQTAIAFPALSAMVLTPYTIATLPSVTPAWRIIAVTDLAGVPAPCYSDGTNWRRFSDDTIAT